MMEVTGVAVSPDSGSVYASSSDQPSALAVFDRDKSTGAVTQLEGAAGCHSVGGQDADGDVCTIANGVEGLHGLVAVAGSRPGCVHVYGAAEDENAVAVFSRQLECAPPAPTAPTATTLAATGVTANSVQIQGLVNPGNADTTYTFELGTTAAYGLLTVTGGVGGGSGDKSVSAAIDGLESGRTYHYRIVATNAGGKATGVDRTFTTAAGGTLPSLGGKTPRVNPRGVTVKVKRKLRRGLPGYTFTGKVLLPLGLSRTGACTGVLAIQIKAKNQTISTRHVNLRKDCSFRGGVQFSLEHRLVKQKRLKVRVRFLGNEVLKPRSAKKISVRA
jgi:hypothetical protein